MYILYCAHFTSPLPNISFLKCYPFLSQNPALFYNAIYCAHFTPPIPNIIRVIFPDSVQVADHEGVLSFNDQEAEEDFTEIILKKPEHSLQQFKKNNAQKKKLSKKKDIKVEVSQTADDGQAIELSQLSKGAIPSPAAIHAARKKRELARSFVSDNNQIILKKSVPSDLISDDDENSDEGSTTVRQFGVTSDSSKQMEVLSAMDNAASGSDEEKFIEEQIYKGVYNLPIGATVGNQIETSQWNENTEVPSNTPIPPNVSIPTITFTPISVESLQSQLRCQLVHLQEQQSKNNDAVRKLDQDIQAAESGIKAMESHSQTLPIQYQFFQEMKCYIRDLLLCLTEKVLFLS